MDRVDATPSGLGSDALVAERDRLAREYGPWVDNVLLADGVATVRPYPTGEEWLTQAVLQVVSDGLGGAVAGARVLDLGAAEGRHSIELALNGADVVAFEGRHGPCEKMRFLRRALSLERLEVVEGDVRTLSREAHGEFDVVLCLGLLYHLERETIVQLLETMASLTTRLAVVDTMVSPNRGARDFAVRGRAYRGRRVREFDLDASAEEQMRLTRSSIGNHESVWLTRPSLYNALVDAGFSSVHELRMPHLRRWDERVLLTAFRGSRQTLRSAPGGEQLEVPRCPEAQPPRHHPLATWRGEAKRRFAPYVPAPVKELARRRREARMRSRIRRGR